MFFEKNRYIPFCLFKNFMILSKFYRYLKAYKSQIYLGLLFIIISNFLSIIVPKIIGKTIDLIANQKFSLSMVGEKISIIILLTVLSGFFMFLARKKIINVSRYIEYDIRNDLLQKISTFDTNFFTKHPTGELMSIMMNDVSASREFIGPAIMYSTNTITTFLFVLAFMLPLDYKLSLLALAPLPAVAVATYFFGRKVHLSFKTVQSMLAELTTHTQEIFSGIRIIKAFLREKYESKNFANKSKDYLSKVLKLELFDSLFIPTLIVLIGLSQLVVLGYGGSKIIAGEISIGTVTQMFIYINMLIWPVIAIGWITNLVQRASASIERIQSIFETENGDEKDNFTKLNIHRIESIEFKNVYFQYDSTNFPVIENLNFTVSNPSIIGLTGRIGSGKTTTLKLLTNIISPTKGKILINGQDIRQISKYRKNKLISFVPQEPFIFSASIEDNICLGNPEFTEAEINFAIEISRLSQDLQSFPNGIKTIVGERGVTISGGQKQRIAIARAVIRKPNVLLLDDSFSSIDSETREKIIENITTKANIPIVIIASNKIQSLRKCNYIFVIESGKIIESGSYNELLERKGKFYSFYQIQQVLNNS